MSVTNAGAPAVFDLFDAPPLPGLATRPDIVTPEEERSLIAAIDLTDLSTFRFQGWLGKRLTSSFGWSYDFDAQRPEEAAPMPDWLLAIRERMASFARLEPENLIQALLIRYDAGAGIGWHRDRPIYEHVVGLSLGIRADMRFRRRRAEGSFDRATLPLEPRAAYHLSGEARHEWEHSIASWIEPGTQSPFAVFQSGEGARSRPPAEQKKASHIVQGSTL